MSRHRRNDHQRNRNERDAPHRRHSPERTECLEHFPRAVDGSGDRRTEESCVEEGLHIGSAEDVVRGVRIFLSSHTEMTESGTGSVERAQHVQQTDEDRALGQQGQAPHQGVETVFLLHLPHFGCLPSTVPGVLPLYCLELGLQFLHGELGTNLADERLDQQRTQCEDQEYHCQGPGEAVVGAEHGPEDSVPEPQHRGDGIVDEIEHGGAPHCERSRSVGVSTGSRSGSDQLEPPVRSRDRTGCSGHGATGRIGLLLPAERSPKPPPVRACGIRRQRCDHCQIGRRTEDDKGRRDQRTEHRYLCGGLGVDDGEDDQQDGENADQCPGVASNRQVRGSRIEHLRFLGTASRTTGCDGVGELSSYSAPTSAPGARGCGRPGASGRC